MRQRDAANLRDSYVRLPINDPHIVSNQFEGKFTAP